MGWENFLVLLCAVDPHLSLQCIKLSGSPKSRHMFGGHLFVYACYISVFAPEVYFSNSGRQQSNRLTSSIDVIFCSANSDIQYVRLPKIVCGDAVNVKAPVDAELKQGAMSW